MRLVECVPNFSEGRDPAVIDAIAEAVRGVDGAVVLDVDPGAGAHRFVLTFVAPPEAAVEAGFRAIRVAAERIDMRVHRGEHPRIGATDVFPFVPIAGVTMKECAALARALGRRVGEELGIPVYLYEHAASREDRRALSAVRSGEYEALPAKLADPAWAPDFGPARHNERSGATVIGARSFLVAYNVNLNTRDRRFAVRIARALREQGRPVRAIGWTIEEYQAAQVSMNLVDIDAMGIHEAFDETVRLAETHGLRVTGSEIVGLVPERALTAAGAHYLQRQGKSPAAAPDELIRMAVRTLGLAEIAPFDPEQRIIERRLRTADRLAALSLERFLGRLASPAPTPGGGSAGALAAALAGALTAMAANLTYERRGFEGVRGEMEQAAKAAQRLLRTGTAGIDADASAYDRLAETMRGKPKDPAEAAPKRLMVTAAAKAAATVPLGIIEATGDLLEALEIVARRGNPACLSDVAAGAAAAGAAAEIAWLNVAANLPSVPDRRWVERTRTRADAARAETVRRTAAIVARARRTLAAAATPPRNAKKP